MHKFLRFIVTLCLIFGITTFAQASGTYEVGDQGDDVAGIQAQLNNLGFNAGAVDGDFGSLTANAVKAFQRSRGLEADGVVGMQTYRALMGRDIPASRDSSTASVRRIVQTSMRYMGVPYVFGGTSPSGFDCSGFTRYIFAQSGIYLPRMADEQFEVGRYVSYGRLQPGDLVFFSTYTSGVSHSGIYIGDGRFISATSSRGVAIDSMDSSYWGPRYIGARRVI
ncbi:C40 family peptidase [Sporomusa acidovorans]|uniref:NlpC/P60 domain-containing protein n=1 Tax=Sporomusa acidovorans (strain ATCC 49682 / DSM 3132 / Mol) TaxID=1123286 RepID=A0ABZ3J270_SPOA4|nr:NlpC/P60 family protein [Sporomusa acidovorans]OZC15005.1 gamma-DL-glutamyl hydrolase precursor [Sporomusa acidovorans DSM 3132]SDE83801.1 Cell wall-associated hydrolase, NlpC family [Sporomusa acidovorans]